MSTIDYTHDVMRRRCSEDDGEVGAFVHVWSMLPSRALVDTMLRVLFTKIPVLLALRLACICFMRLYLHIYSMNPTSICKHF